MHKEFYIFGKLINVYLGANSLPLPIFKLSLFDNEYYGLMIIDLSLMGVCCGIQVC